MCGQVQRYHTWPAITRQSNAEHSWQVARLVLAIHPAASRDLLLVCLLHDIGEGATGDIPSYTKRETPALSMELDHMEHQAHLQMCIPWYLPPPRPLAHFENWVLKIADVLDRWEWALQEQMMGNRLARIVETRSEAAIEGLMEYSTDPYHDVQRTLAAYMSKRRREWAQ